VGITSCYQIFTPRQQRGIGRCDPAHTRRPFRRPARFGFDPHYAEVPSGDGATLRVHYLDEGPPDAAPVLLMHGEPSWCFLYRKVIPGLVAAGHRCVVPDLVGFGRSDKPTRTDDYTYARHVSWMSAWAFDVLDLRGATFFGQDWGGLIGLRMVAAAPERFERIVVANTGLPTGDQRMTDAFLAWQRFSKETDDFDVGAIVNMGCGGSLPDHVVAAYDAPFPDDSYKAGARIFPSLVPTGPDDPAAADNRRAWKVLEAWTKPLLTAFSDPTRHRGGERYSTNGCRAPPGGRTPPSRRAPLSPGGTGAPPRRGRRRLLDATY